LVICAESTGGALPTLQAATNGYEYLRRVFGFVLIVVSIVDQNTPFWNRHT
jgi:hypothetical protein